MAQLFELDHYLSSLKIRYFRILNTMSSMQAVSESRPYFKYASADKQNTSGD